MRIRIAGVSGYIFGEVFEFHPLLDMIAVCQLLPLPIENSQGDRAFEFSKFLIEVRCKSDVHMGGHSSRYECNTSLGEDFFCLD